MVRANKRTENTTGKHVNLARVQLHIYRTPLSNRTTLLVLPQQHCVVVFHFILLHQVSSIGLVLVFYKN